MEIVGENWRTVFGIMYQSFFSVSYMLLSAYAYAWRNWHDMMVMSFQEILLIVIFFQK